MINDNYQFLGFPLQLKISQAPDSERPPYHSSFASTAPDHQRLFGLSQPGTKCKVSPFCDDYGARDERE